MVCDGLIKWLSFYLQWIDRMIITLKWDRVIITLKCHKPVVCDLKIKWHSFLTKITKIAIILFNLTVNSVFFRSGLSKVHFFSKFHFSDIKRQRQAQYVCVNKIYRLFLVLSIKSTCTLHPTPPTHTHPPHTPPAHTGTYIISTPTTESDQRLGIIVRTANTVRQSLAHSAVL